MTGYPAFNFPAFIAADQYLHGQGWTTFNPATHEIETGIVPDGIFEMTGDHQELADAGHVFDLSEALRRDMNAIADNAAIILLPGWQMSSGACLELRAAVWARKEVWTLDLADPEPLVQVSGAALIGECQR